MKEHFVRVISTTVSLTHATMVPVLMALPATPVTVILATRDIAVRTSSMSATATLVKTGASVWTWLTSTSANANMEPQVRGEKCENLLSGLC